MTEPGEAHPRSLISAFLDGELAESERAAVEAHVVDCSSCRALLEDFRAMAATATREEPPPIPADLRSRIRLKIAAAGAEAAAPPRRRIVYQRLGLAAAASIVLAIGLWTTRWEDAPPPSSPISGPAVPVAVAPSHVAENKKEKVTEPAAPADRGKVEPLGALGYIEDESAPKRQSAPSAAGAKTVDQPAHPSRSPAPAAAGQARDREGLQTPSSIETRDFVAPSPRSGPSSAVVSEAGGDRKDMADSLKEGVPMSARPPVADLRSATAGSSGQVLQFIYATCQVSVEQDGTVALSTEDYSCVVRREGASVDPDIAALFVLAASTREAPGAPARPGGAVVRLLQPRPGGESASGAAAGVDLSGPKGTAIETRFRTLLRERYLPLMERRCGAAPRMVPAP